MLSRCRGKWVKVSGSCKTVFTSVIDWNFQFYWPPIPGLRPFCIEGSFVRTQVLNYVPVCVGILLKVCYDFLLDLVLRTIRFTPGTSGWPSNNFDVWGSGVRFEWLSVKCKIVLGVHYSDVRFQMFSWPDEIWWHWQETFEEDNGKTFRPVLWFHILCHK